jgi:uncharacterized protein
VVAALAITIVPRLTPPSAEPLALAQSPAPSKGITVVGAGRVRIKPDLATIRLGVRTQAMTAQQAQDDNAQKMQTVISALKGLGLADKDLQTSAITLRAVYENENNPNPTAQNRIVAYEAVNMVTARITDLSKVGPVVDEAIKSGANAAEGIQFGLQDDGAQRKEALTKAVQDAQSKADAIAKAMGRALTAAESATEESISYPQMAMDSYAMGKGMAASAAMPVEVGEMEISAQVRVVYGF